MKSKKHRGRPHGGRTDTKSTHSPRGEPGQAKSGEKSHGGGRGFVFRDRTGKLHHRGAPRPADFDPAPAEFGGGERAERGTHAGRPHSGQPSRQDRPARGGRPDREERGGFKGFGGKGGMRPRGGGAKRRSGKTGGETPESGVKLKATVDKNRKGFGFLVFENRRFDDAFIPPRAADRLFHGDRVEVTIGGRGEVIDLRVLEHRFRELVGRFTPYPSQQHPRAGWVVYERKRAREEIFAPQGHAQAKPNDWVRAKLEFHGEGAQYPVTARIEQVYGQDLPPAADIGMVAAEYNLIEEHSPEAVAEAEAFRLEWDPATRKDLRQVPFITIDGETARDFDDAVYVERHAKGHVLWVAIADVSHYVKPGTALDAEALSRATSVYFPERAFHMLPRALSENLCSLRPHEPRLAMVAKMGFDRQGKRLWTDVFEGIIESQRRATYNEIQREWDANRSDAAWEFHPHFELYQTLRKARSGRGSIDFELPEAELKVAPTGEVLSISQRPRLDAHRLIEEFMIAANEAVTDWALARDWPFIYRVHEEPAEVSLGRFEELARHLGVQVAIDREADIGQALADVIRRLDGHPAQALLNMALLRSMKQAVYSAVHGGHFGLASPGYTHFTSPIRRYPDLIVHRMLRHAIQIEAGREPRPGEEELRRIEQDLDEKAEHCSYRERIASDAERESIKLKQVRAMVGRLGEEFDGKVIGMAESGLFVEIRDPYVEGMVAADTLLDDHYQYDESRMVFIGRRKKRQLRIGDEVRIQVVRADLDRRQIDFGMISHTAAGKTHVFPEGGIAAAREREPEQMPLRGGKGGMSYLPMGGGGGRGGKRGRRDEGVGRHDDLGAGGKGRRGRDKSWKDREPGGRGRDERAPQARRDERGPHPRRDERGPQVRRDDRGGPGRRDGAPGGGNRGRSGKRRRR